MNVLFVCNGNVARSQEAEVYFNALVTGTKHHAQSAGINVKIGKPIDPLVLQVMKEDGFLLDSVNRKFISEEMIGETDLIVSFKPENELPVYARRSDVVYWEVADPQSQDLAFHRATRDKVKRLVAKLIADLPKE